MAIIETMSPPPVMNVLRDVLVAVLLASAGPSACRSSSQPVVESIPPLMDAPDSAPAGLVWGLGVAEGFLRPCQILSSEGGVIELACGQHQVVEFRSEAQGEGGAAIPGAGDAEEDGQSPGLEALMRILRARFGALRETRGVLKIDSQQLSYSQFDSLKPSESAPRGVALFVSNTQGQFWGLVCYRKGDPVNQAFCGDALSSAARAGGLAYVHAHPLRVSELGEGRLRVPENCQHISGRKIICESAELSWSGKETQNSSVLREETLRKLRLAEGKKNIRFSSSKRHCSLWGKTADCTLVTLENIAKKEFLNFVLLIGGDQERLVVCSAPGVLERILPVPCMQAISLSDRL